MTDKYLGITDKPGLARDVRSHAVVSTDIVAFENAKKRSKAALQLRQQVESQRIEIDALHAKMEKLQALLMTLLHPED